MIWVNISELLKGIDYKDSFRIEYQICLHAINLIEQGYDISFSTFEHNLGFVRIETNNIKQILSNHNASYTRTRPSRSEKLKRSIFKRMRVFRKLISLSYHPFQNNDYVIHIAQNLDIGELLHYQAIKKETNIHLSILCHDLLPIINQPKHFINRTNDVFRHYINVATNTANQFYCASNFIKNEIEEYLEMENYLGLHDCGKLNITLTQLGSNLYRERSVTNPSFFLKKITSSPYLLFVSNIEDYKNHQLIFDLYLRLKDITNLPKLVFAGRRGWYSDRILKTLSRNPYLKENIYLADNISQAGLVYLYQNCWFTLHPSFIEGYGLPVADSLSFGKYCLSSNAGALPEIGGDFIDYLDPYAVDKWHDMLLFLINNPHYIHEKELHIQQSYKPNSWEDCTKHILNIETNQ